MLPDRRSKTDRSFARQGCLGLGPQYTGPPRPRHQSTVALYGHSRTIMFMSHRGVAAGPGAILLPLRYTTERCFMPVLAPLRATPLRLRIAGHERPEHVALDSTKLRLHHAKAVLLPGRCEV